MCWDNVTLLSFHEGNEENKNLLIEVLKNGRAVMILPNPKNFTPKHIARFLLDRGINGETRTFICENLTLKDERVIQCTLKDVVSLETGSLCIMVIIPGGKN